MKLPLQRVAERSCLGTHTPFRPSLPLHNSPLTSLKPHRPWHCRHISNETTSLKKETRTESSPSATEAHELQTSTAPTTSSSTSSIPEQVRLLMRRVPYPVTIITATDPDTTSFRGMTVSSFNTVTLTPQPVISFNVRRPSETLNALLSSGRFLVHLLSPSCATARLARDFSKGNTTLATMLSGHAEFEFGPLDPKSGSLPLPILRRKETSPEEQSNADTYPYDRVALDFPFVFECTLHPHKIDVHDHSIVLGTVVRTIQGAETRCPEHGLVDASQEHSSSPDRLCLTYANTRFWKMGNEIL